MCRCPARAGDSCNQGEKQGDEVSLVHGEDLFFISTMSKRTCGARGRHFHPHGSGLREIPLFRRAGRSLKLPLKREVNRLVNGQQLHGRSKLHLSAALIVDA